MMRLWVGLAYIGLSVGSVWLAALRSADPNPWTATRSFAAGHQLTRGDIVGRIASRYDHELPLDSLLGRHVRLRLMSGALVGAGDVTTLPAIPAPPAGMTDVATPVSAQEIAAIQGAWDVGDAIRVCSIPEASSPARWSCACPPLALVAAHADPVATVTSWLVLRVETNRRAELTALLADKSRIFTTADTVGHPPNHRK